MPETKNPVKLERVKIVKGKVMFDYKIWMGEVKF